ncbi:hypothetical protein [uncultured Parasphingorhabdus sp.]|uniref:hypothetical protein n=1 Tax=uncultured Parasphingorhabdus sp. TaxID=2709694 RepID=UPI003747B38B
MKNDQPDNFSSSVQENILEHQFLAALTASLWRRGFRDIEVLRAEVDAFGHDLVVEAGGVVRHIQLKASGRQAKTARVKINTRLSLKPAGCVIWYLDDPGTLELGPFRWFGNRPGAGLPDLGNRVAKHTKGDGAGNKAERKAIRVLPKARFTVVETIDEIASLLFGYPSGSEIQLIRQQLAQSDLPDCAPDWVHEVRGGNLGAVPDALDWNNSVHFAHLVDGYRICEILGLGDPFEFEAWILENAQATGIWPCGPAVLWATLFLEHRRWRTAPIDPDPETVDLLDRLCQQLGGSL